MTIRIAGVATAAAAPLTPAQTPAPAANPSAPAGQERYWSTRRHDRRACYAPYPEAPFGPGGDFFPFLY